MLSMSVEHANQLRQLIVEKHRPQPAGLANVYSLIIIYYSQCTIRQPKVIFLHMPAGKHKKNLFHETASACHITPLGHLERPREGYKSMTKPASGTFTNSTALRPSQGLHLVTDHEYMLTSSSIFIHRRRHQTSTGFFLSISSVFIII